MVVRVIDIETTGMDPATDAIIEIASVDLVKGGGITNARSTYVAPGRPIPPLASAVHYITDEDLRDAPPLSDALTMFTGADIYVRTTVPSSRAFSPGIRSGRSPHGSAPTNAR
jgi:DNA polymerase III epsilon subunit-like protein